MDIRKIAVGGAIAVVIGTFAAASPTNLTAPQPGVVIDTAPGAISLVSFDSCETALNGFRRAAMPYIGPYGFGGPMYAETDSGGASADALEAAPAPAAGAAAPQQQSEKSTGERSNSAAGQGGAQAPSHSGTNTHEAGVDEPDIVKTDGKRLVSIADGRLTVVDVASRKVTGTLGAPDGHVSQMLVAGDRALLVTDRNNVVHDMPVPPRGKPAPDVGSGKGSGSSLVLVDLAGTPRILGTLTVDGGYVDARQVGSVARVVVRSQPKLKFVYPDGTRTRASSLDENRELVRDAPIEDWLPRYQLERDGAKSEGRLVDCNRVSHPSSYTGTGMLTVLTLDLTRDLGTGDPVSVAADGDTVYGSGTSLYIADDRQSRVIPMSFDRRSVPGQPRLPDRTQIHRFDIAGAGPPKYAGSGQVEGTLLNQYSLSEHNGHLRVATTVGQTGSRNARQQSHSMVTVLARGANSLTEVGKVDGLGKGERIYAVRFFGAVGYVVTFRQVDPLYTLDLSQPAKPRVVGELKITGYSAYLHPVGEGKVIGVGQEATEQGRRLGSQVSLFDVANPATPNRMAQLQIEGGSSEVEYDAHAFLYWPARNLVVVPVMDAKIARSLNGDYRQANYALVLKIDQGRITEAGRVTHTTGMIRRSLVIGEELWTVSDAGLMVSALDGLGQRAWIPLR
ncbi:MAG: beta-propeller domain-containing protein [Kibdelosporangium sp.]